MTIVPSRRDERRRRGGDVVGADVPEAPALFSTKTLWPRRGKRLGDEARSCP
jgi:hypothetical protein